MKGLSIRDPWATLIARGVKDVENRTWATTYRGPLAIQVSKRYDADAHHDPVAAAAFTNDDRIRRIRREDMPTGVVIAVVDLVGCHRHWRTGNGCDTTNPVHTKATLCSPWGQQDVWHLQLANPRLLPTPVPLAGFLGIRSLDPAVVDQITAQL